MRNFMPSMSPGLFSGRLVLIRSRKPPTSMWPRTTVPASARILVEMLSAITGSLKTICALSGDLYTYGRSPQE